MPCWSYHLCSSTRASNYTYYGKLSGMLHAVTCCAHNFLMKERQIGIYSHYAIPSGWFMYKLVTRWMGRDVGDGNLVYDHGIAYHFNRTCHDDECISLPAIDMHGDTMALLQALHLAAPITTLLMSWVQCPQVQAAVPAVSHRQRASRPGSSSASTHRGHLAEVQQCPGGCTKVASRMCAPPPQMAPALVATKLPPTKAVHSLRGGMVSLSPSCSP